jgi:thiol-disulfide isomerase/thioredoxin
VGICEASLGDAAAARATFEKVVAKHADKPAEVKKAQQYLHEIGLVGQAARPIRADSWIRGLAADGLKSFEGDVRVLVFFATWCDNCSAENPHLRSLMEELGAKGVVFIGIANPDDPKNTVAVDVYLEREKMPYLDVALDRTLASWDTYRVRALPAAAVIDRKGLVRWRGHPAFLPKALVERLLGEEVQPSS